MARRGRGLPARILPFAVNEVTQIGFEFLSAAFAYGAAQLLILVPPEKSGELEALAGQIGLMETVMAGLGFGSGRIDVLREQDPEIVEAELYGLATVEPAAAGSFLPMGGKRALIRLALGHLHDVAQTPMAPLPLAPTRRRKTLKPSH